MPVHATLDETGKVPVAQLPAGMQGDKGPAGDKGATGDKGPTGDQGPAGDPAVIVAATISDADTTHAPSGDVLFHALAAKVATVSGSSLVADTEIAKIHANTLDHSNASDHAVGDSIAAAITDGDTTHSPNGDILFHALAAKGASNLTLGDLSTNAYAGDKGKTAYDHSQAAHAPSNAQKNSDVTKAEVEAKLTGTVTSHDHTGVYDPAGTGNTEATDHVAAHAALRTGIHGVNASYAIMPQGNPDAETTGAVTIHIADMLTGIVSGAPSAARAYTLDTGSNCDAGMTISSNESFDWVLINLATTAAYIITLTAAAGHTIVGNPLIAAQSATTGGLWGTASAIFRTRKTAANTFITYRIA